MLSRVIAVSGLMAVCTLVAAPVASAQRPAGGCKAFGNNVAALAQGLGADFGATASGVARAFPGAFPALVVMPEQEAFCE